MSDVNDYELWEAVYVSTEDMDRKPQSVIYFLGRGIVECARAAAQHEGDVTESYIEKDICYDDGGLPMLYSLRYLGMPWIIDNE